jgi:Cu(I)/Ag(I) efflux system membrane fusion protein
MKKRCLILASALLAVSGAVFYFSQSGVGVKSAVEKSPQPAPAATPDSGHEGHAKGKEQAGPEPVREEQEGEAPTVEIPPEKQQLIGVKTAAVSVRSLDKFIRTVGRIEYDEKRLATINTKFEGWIEKLYVDYTGKYVKKGEPLAEVYSPELMATQQEFLNVLKWVKNSSASSPSDKGGSGGDINRMFARDADTLVEAARQRLRLWDISDAQIHKIEESGKPIRTLILYSPVNGYVVQKMALQGTRVMPGEKLFDIADLSTVWIISDIYEYELSSIKVGETARLALSYFPGKEFSSRIDYVYPTLSGETRTAKVRFVIPNPNGQLKPQMFTNVEVKINLGKKLAIPDDAVIDTGTRQIVYVEKGEGLFEPREVMLGLRAEGFREVLMGLRAGERVASSATFHIDSEAQLKGVKPLGGHKH